MAPTPPQQDVRLAVIPEELYQYLIFVFQTHCEKGLPAEELAAAAALYTRIKAMPKIDFTQLGNVKMEHLAPGSVAISMQPESDTARMKKEDLCTWEIGGYCGLPAVFPHPEHSSHGPGPVNLCPKHEEEHARECDKPHCRSKGARSK